MDGNVAPLRPLTAPEIDETGVRRPSRDEAMAAVRTLLAWAGDDPDREGLVDTPKRVVDAYEDWFGGYAADAGEELARTFENRDGYDDIVMLRDIDVESHCEHHMAAFLGRAWVAYKPAGRVVGLSKLARVVEIYSRRLQNQEALTAQIAQAIEDALRPEGVAVLIDAAHQCMTTRGLRHKDVSTITSRFTGVFKTDAALQERFLRLRGGELRVRRRLPAAGLHRGGRARRPAHAALRRARAGGGSRPARRHGRGADAGLDERRGAGPHAGDGRGLVLEPLAAALWRKGATSGQVQRVAEVRIDCDQDAVLLRVRPKGDGGACHLGERAVSTAAWTAGDRETCGSRGSEPREPPERS
jgi:GTP cyclohydrolase I